MPGGDLGLNPWLSDFRRLMDEGNAGIVQGVGYPNSSRSHLRSTEIWETGSIGDPAPTEGWLGRYLDHACECGGGAARRRPVRRESGTDARVASRAQPGDRQHAAPARA